MKIVAMTVFVFLLLFNSSLKAEELKTPEKLEAQLDMVSQLLNEARGNVKDLGKNFDLMTLQIQEIRLTLNQQSKMIDDNRRKIDNSEIYVAEVKKKIEEQTFKMKVFLNLFSFFAAIITLVVGFMKWQYITKSVNIVIRRLGK